jgi:hypothetical protein
MTTTRQDKAKTKTTQQKDNDKIKTWYCAPDLQTLTPPMGGQVEHMKVVARLFGKTCQVKV